MQANVVVLFHSAYVWEPVPGQKFTWIVAPSPKLLDLKNQGKEIVVVLDRELTSEDDVWIRLVGSDHVYVPQDPMMPSRQHYLDSLKTIFTRFGLTPPEHDSFPNWLQAVRELLR